MQASCRCCPGCRARERQLADGVRLALVLGVEKEDAVREALRLRRRASKLG